ncbi:hypothetical protein P9883_026500 [Klebsiella pneumoniae]|uniref:hypothetical protein n=1 Tax=Klebsiella pneumoniae TaxID=573 RepID=UPI00254F2D35|nr:hypothetical protein [Klebsiella pneumoniae]MEC5583631.1 hypothetical protein [Klebsiella pneumoniae]
MRLMVWYSLEQRATGISGRNASFASKIAALQQAQAAGQVSESFPPAFLLITIMALSTAWSAASPFGTFCDNMLADDIRNMLQRMIEKMIRPE